MLSTLIKGAFRFCGYDLKRLPRQKASDSAEQDAIASLRAAAASRTEIKLHCGCGPRILKGWLNIDLAFEPFQGYMQYYTDQFYPEGLRGDSHEFFALDVTRTGIPLTDASVDVVFHEDFLEHLAQRDQVVFLAEALRVLKPGGIHRVNTPDLLSSMRAHSDFSRGMAGVYVAEWVQHGHLNVLSRKGLEEMARMIGYKEVIFNGRDLSLAKEALPREYRPAPNDRPEDGNIFADLIK